MTSRRSTDDAGQQPPNGKIETLIGELRLLYQPIVRLTDMRPAFVEVLARTVGENGTLSGPEAYLAAMISAEASMALTAAILSRGLVEQAGHRLDVHDARFFFNLPLDAMLHPGLIGMIESIRAGGVPAGKIGFELTERDPVQDVEQFRGIIGGLSAAGYSVALDDVTPETPNLAALLELPLQIIKLDRGVVISGAADDAAFIRRLAAAARAKGQALVAEGIETADILSRMLELGVTHGQGFLFARPLTAPALQSFLESRKIEKR